MSRTFFTVLILKQGRREDARAEFSFAACVHIRSGVMQTFEITAVLVVSKRCNAGVSDPKPRTEVGDRTDVTLRLSGVADSAAVENQAMAKCRPFLFGQ